MAEESKNGGGREWLAPTISAGAQIGNTLVNQMFAERNRERNFYWNEKAADNSDKRRREYYADIESPKAQVQQLLEAGLSPSLMYGDMGGSSGSAAPQGAGVSGAYPSGSMVDPLTLAQIANINADTKLKESQTDNTNKDTELKGQEIINLIADTENKRVQNRVLAAENDILELEYSTNLQTAQAKIREAYSKSEQAAAAARSATVQADIDEATFDVAYKMAYANLNNMLTDTALKKSEIKVNKAQIKQIAEEIRASTWETWQIEKEENRKDAIFELDKEKLKADVKLRLLEIQKDMSIAQIEMVSDLIGYIVNLATCALTNAAQIQKTQMYTNAQKEIQASKPKKTVETETIVNGKRQMTTKTRTRSQQ